MRCAIAMILILLAVSSAADAVTLDVPSEFVTIQAAIDAASEGDTVAVAPGTYSEIQVRVFQAAGSFTASAVVFLKPGVTVVAIGGPSQTTLQANVRDVADESACVYAFAQLGPTMKLEGFKVTSTVDLTGVRVTNSGSLEMRDCVLEGLDGSVDDLPGGLYTVLNEPVTLRNCEFIECVGGQFQNLGSVRASGTSLRVVD